MLGAVLPKIVRMGLAPFFLAVARYLAILLITLQLLPVIIGSALALAWWLTANSLLGTVDGRKKSLLAVGTALGWEQADSFRDQKINL